MGGHAHGFLAARDHDHAVAWAIAWAPSATARRPEPQTILMPQAGVAMAGRRRWRPGAPDSGPGPPSNLAENDFRGPRRLPALARSSTALMAASPSLCAGTVAKAPLKEPTGVRAPATITTSSTGICLSIALAIGFCFGFCLARKMPRMRAGVTVMLLVMISDTYNGKNAEIPCCDC